MWADLLQELPEEYTVETAIANLIDNSLQAVWANEAGDRKLIRVKTVEKGIEIFDSGPGMDDSPENSLVKWGELGASMHRLARESGMGIEPPYLMPCFGMFGCGGPIAAMYLGRHALVSSKTKQSKKVFFLHLDKEAILKSNTKQRCMRIGSSQANLKESAHGSFTKVQIQGVKLQGSIEQVRSRLKDIYFPYIQCDEGMAASPIEFQVDGVNLAEVPGGEVAITNMHSCNGPEFTLQLQFNNLETSSSSTGEGYQKANARLRCVFFPIIEGKESIDSILEKLEEDECGVGEDFKSFSRVSVRRLGRLLPGARWAWLPFMEPKEKWNAAGQISNRLRHRVKCFIDTDAGFNPNASKTDLAAQNAFTIALKTFGKKETNKEIDVAITKDGRELSLSEVEKLYEEWLLLMHHKYDQETGCDEAVFLIDPPNEEDLGISSTVIRVHKRFWRNGTLWKSGQNVKILKGACAGFHNNDTYATLECILLEGFEGDASCKARLICRPIEAPVESGCLLTRDQGISSIRLGSSFSIPVSVIDSNKFIAVDDALWQQQLQRQSLKAPSCIELLGAADFLELENIWAPSSSKGKRVVSNEAAELDQSLNVHHVPCNVIHESDLMKTVQADQMVPDTVEHVTLQELEIKINKTGEQAKVVEDKIQILVDEQTMLKESFGKLQADYVALSKSNPFSFASELDLGKTNSAAAAVCQLPQPQWDNVLGVVAGIGSVHNENLSRILACYLGEEQMLAVVCKRICALAANHGMTVPNNCHLYCIEDISPYSGPVSRDSQRKLLLPDPRLPSGECPPGFVGYAVNMINLDLEHRLWRTASGHGLRETLLYQLFNNLQVYQRMDQMNRACITGEAVSLDGAALRRNGRIAFLLSNMNTQFPVCPEVSEPVKLVERQIEAKMEALREVNNSLRKERAAHEDIIKRFNVQKRRFEALLDEEEQRFI